MKLTYFRSSLLGNLKVCEHQAYINYQLGFDSKVGKKATLGTTTHKILEVLARIKKQFDLSKKGTVAYTDDEIGFSLEVKKDEFLLESTLSPIEIDKINTSRINKSVYKTDASIKYNHVRYGIALVEKISNICIEHYRKHDHNKWEPIDERHVKNWVWMALDYNNGMFDPRKRTIVCTENHFDIELKEDWAGYEYFIGDQHIKGQLRLKGTIDLTTQIDNDTYEIVDWKSGQKLDFGTGLPKTYDSLHSDPQLLLYYYVASQLYPDKNIQMTIFFIRDGGPYTLCFGQKQIDQAFEMFEKVFKDIKSMKLPKLLDHKHKHFMCNRVCTYYKEKMNDQRICDFIHKEIKKNGIDYVTETYTKDGHNISYYQAPGAVSEQK